MKKRDFLTFNLNLSKKNLKFLNFEKQSVNKEGFLLDKIREISKAWKYPVYDHKHKAIDIINSLKGVNKSYFLHAASVASPFARRYFGLKLAYERKSINEFGLKFDSSKIEYPFFIFDENFFLFVLIWSPKQTLNSIKQIDCKSNNFHSFSPFVIIMNV